MSCRVSCVQQARGVFGLHNERLYMLEFGYLERLDRHSALRRPGGNLRRLIVCLYLYYSLHNI